MTYLVPVVIIFVFVLGLVKRVNVYQGFVGGAKKSLHLALSVFPYVVAMLVMVNVMRASGVDRAIINFVAPPFELVGVPKEVLHLMLLRPFSGSGSLAILTDVFNTYGVDSYVSRAASVIMGSSETVFYLSAVYFAQTKVVKTGWAVPIALFCNFVGGVCACLLCRVM